jgi:hypothetical protein
MLVHVPSLSELAKLPPNIVVAVSGVGCIGSYEVGVTLANSSPDVTAVDPQFDGV